MKTSDHYRKFSLEGKLAEIASASLTKNEAQSLQRSQDRHTLIGSAFLSGMMDDRLLNLEGVTINISDRGACVYVKNKLDEDLEFLVSGKVFGMAARKARVVWCERVVDEVFKVGISFSGDI